MVPPLKVTDDDVSGEWESYENDLKFIGFERLKDRFL